MRFALKVERRALNIERQIKRKRLKVSSGIRRWTLSVRGLAFLAILLMPLAGLMAQPAPEAPEVPEDPQVHLEQVMSDPLFSRWELRQMRAEGQSVADADWARWVDLTLQELGQWIEDFFKWLFGGPRSGGGANWGPSGDWSGLSDFLETAAYVIAGLLLLAILAAAVKLIREHRRQGAGVTLSREQIREALETGEALAADSRQWTTEADRLADEQDLRLAFRALYLALLSGLHKSQRIDFRRNRTNWTYVTHYRGPDEEQGLFAGLTERFDDVWYGLRQPDRDAFGQVKREVGSLLTEGDADA